MKNKLSLSAVAFFLLAACSTTRGAPLKVFILSGQSNMQGHASVTTLPSMRLDPETASILEEMVDEQGAPVICEHVWISSIGSSEEERVGKLTAGFGPAGRGEKIGPEFTFGIYAQKLLKEPVLIIKTAWGGKSINTDFRPPSAGPYEYGEKQIESMKSRGKDVEKARADRAAASGHYYRLMMEHVKKVLGDIKRVVPGYDPEQGYELAGFVWFQGWNDMVDSGTYPQRGQPGGYDAYSTVLADFIRDVRKDLETPDLPFVIGVMGVNGPTSLYTPDMKRYLGIHQGFRDAMAAPAALPEFKENVTAVLTEKYWDNRVTALRKKEKGKKDELNRQLKSKQITRDAYNKALEEFRTQSFSEEELELLTESTSNAEYHYMGSARIMSQIGKAFAEAAVALGK